MNLKDIIDLAKAGYKPNDVKELIALAEAHEQKKEEPEEEEKKEEPKEEEKKEEPKEEEKKEDKKEQEIESLKSQVKKLQEDNARKDASSEVKDDADILADFVRGFM